MSGHSKWSKIKHQKATTDVVKGAEFTKAAYAITIAVREGGGVGNPDHNFHLRLAVEKAHDVNMPKENIARAIEKGKGMGAGSVEQVLYEGYGPGGVALLIEAATDNKQRTVAVVKNLFDRHGCALATPGAVSYLFIRCGVLTVEKGTFSYDTLIEWAIEASADDVIETQDMFEIYSSVSALSKVKEALQARGMAIDNTEIIMKPKSAAPFPKEKQKGIDAFIEELEMLDDVQKVFTNIGSYI